MIGSTQRKLKSKIICERTLDDVGEGTSARTRPLTYDEIMLKRKSKKELEGFIEEEHEVEATRPEESVSNPDFESRGINEAGKKNARDHQPESSPRKVEKGYRTTEHKERHDVEDSRDHQRDFSPRKVGKNPRAEHTHSKIENKERRGVDNSRYHLRESSPRKKVEKSSRTEHTHKIESRERHDVENSRDYQRESSDRKVEKSVRAEHSHNKSEGNERHSFENSRDHQRDSSPRRKVEKSSRTEHTHSKSGDIEKRDAEKSRNQWESSPRTKVEKSSKTEHTHSKSENKEKRDAEDPRGHQQESSPRRKVEKSSRAEHSHNKSENKEKRGVNDSRDHQRESSPRGKVEKSSRTEHTHSKIGNKEKRDAEDRSKHKHDNDMKNASESIDDRQGRMRSKAEVQARGDGRDSKYGYENKHKNSAVQDKYVERNGGASERENKRRDRGGDDEIYRLRDPVKKHDSGSRWGSEISEGKDKTEPSRSRFDEPRSKRRRSRSQERSKEKVRKSSSSSPKAQKVVSDHVHDHVEPSSRSERDRSRRHSDVDRSKMPSDVSSSHHRRHGGSSSGLGGYSPRKRKSEAAVKTPSPIRSPDRKIAGWNPPSGSDKNLSTAAPGTLPVSQPKLSNMIGLAAGVSVASSMIKPIAAILSNSQSAFKQTSIDSVQLTQATRPMRRLYIDNIPGSATEKDIMECFNNFLVSSGSNYIRGAHPCISCMIHKEKRQALVEFLTPEDASAALSFDGRSLSGSVLKIRRPKDFVDVPVRSSGFSEKSKVREESTSEVSISNIVKDSPHKIFVGGIAEGLSSEMLMEIVSAFGTLKAFRFEFNEDLKETCAFLEYADQSVTLKACAGLNCMKLGGKVLTVTQAFPNTESLQESFGNCPFYGIPEHVKPLLQEPTRILKLKNVFDEKALNLLSEMDLEDIVEDVRLECSRFGSVVSINVVKGGKTPTSISESKDVTYDNRATQFTEKRIHHLNANPTEVAADHDDGDGRNEELLCSIQKFDAGEAVEEDEKLELAPATTNPDIESGAVGTTIVDDSKEADKTSAHNCDGKADNDLQVAAFGVSTADDMGVENESKGNHQEASVQESVVSSELNSNGSFGVEKSGNGERRCADDVSELGKNDNTSQEAVPSPTHLRVTSKDSNFEKSCDATDKEFEVGCLLVEFRRMEASCMAAHCLHGRAYDDRIVTVEYVPLKAYRESFPK